MTIIHCPNYLTCLSNELTFNPDNVTLFFPTNVIYLNEVDEFIKVIL